MLKGNTGLERRNKGETKSKLVQKVNMNVTTGTKPVQARMTPRDKADWEKWMTDLATEGDMQVNTARLMRGLLEMHRKGKIKNSVLLKAIRDTLM